MTYKFICEKGNVQNFFIRIRKENISRIFVLINATSENFEVLVSRKELKDKKIDFSFKMNRFFIKYSNFNDLQRVFMSFVAKERIKYEISLKFIMG